MALTIFRAHRKTEFWSARTPANLGPGSYAGSQLASARDTAVKFSIKSERAVSSGHADRSMHLNDSFPGPGTYSQEVRQKDSSSRAGSSSFVSRQHRLAPNAPGATVYCYPSSYRNPGPGHYGTPERKTTPRLPPRRQNSVHAEPTATSIPTQAKKVEVTDSDLGPGYYNPSDEPTRRKSTGTNFYRSKYSRQLWETTNRQENPYPSRENPGPGHYTPSPRNSGEVQGHSSFLSKVKMAHEESVPEDKRMPGPGAYDAHESSTIPTGKQPGFGSSIERGETWSYDMALPYTKPERSSVPGVGSYVLDDAIRHKEESKKKALHIEETAPQPPAFLSTVTRDCLAEQKPDSKPGPGTYEAQSSIRQQNYSLHIESGAVKFLSNEERFVGLFQPKEGPSPGQYQNAKQPEPTSEGHSTFKSRSDRFNALSRENPNIAVIGNQVRPPVGEYELMRKWAPKENRAPDFRRIVASKMSFESSADRFHRNEPFPGHRATTTPGPGHYRKSQSQRPATRPVILKAQRFAGHGDYKGKLTTNPEVGPGHYAVESTLVKKSFNMTIEAADMDKPKPWT